MPTPIIPSPLVAALDQCAHHLTGALNALNVGPSDERWTILADARAAIASATAPSGPQHENQRALTFKQFQATGSAVDDVDPERLWSDEPLPGRLYVGGLYIERSPEGYHLTIANWSSGISGNLEGLEHALYEFAISEGVIEPPTTEAELLAALRGLMEYVGGWDSPAGHPCRVAADLLARLEA
jgi:hypothetical protein